MDRFWLGNCIGSHRGGWGWAGLDDVLIQEGRAIHLPVPIQTFPEVLSRHRPPLAHRPIRLGFVGRVDHEQKRVERFVPLLAALDHSGLDYTMEFLGSGNAEEHLKKLLGKRKKSHLSRSTIRRCLLAHSFTMGLRPLHERL